MLLEHILLLTDHNASFMIKYKCISNVFDFCFYSIILKTVSVVTSNRNECILRLYK